MRALVEELRASRLRRRARQRALQVVPEVTKSCRTPPRGACSISAKATAVPIDLVIGDEVPDLLRASSAQGRVAHSSVPRRVRARRHALQRLRRTRPRTSRCASGWSRSTRRCSANAGACSRTPRPRPTRARDSTASTSTRALPSAAARCPPAQRGPIGQLPALGRPAGSRQAGRSRDSGAGACAGRPVAGHRRHRDAAAANSRRLTPDAGPDRARRVSRRGRRRRFHRPLQRARSE